MILRIVEIVLLGYVAICGAVIFDKLREISIDIECILKWKASDVADQLIKDGYITKKEKKSRAKV